MSRIIYPRSVRSPARAGPQRAVASSCVLAAALGLFAACAGAPQAQAGDNPVAGSGQSRYDRPLTADRPGEYGLGRGTVPEHSGKGSPKAGSGDPNWLGAKGSPYNSRSSGRLKGPGLEGNSITGGSVTRD